MEDFAGQVCEWTATTRTHHDVLFALVKGASWLHRDPLSYRRAASFWAMAGFYTPWIGFRCALDAGNTPPSVARNVPANQSQQTARLVSSSEAGTPQVYFIKDAPEFPNQNLLSWSRLFIEGHLPELSPHSRSFLLHVPSTGSWSVCLFLAETLSWSGRTLLAGLKRTDPPLQKVSAAQGRTAYTLAFDDLSVRYEFVLSRDYIDLVTTVANKTDTPEVYETTSCFSLTSHPTFYDPEGLRTYVLSGRNEFVAFR